MQHAQLAIVLPIAVALREAIGEQCRNMRDGQVLLAHGGEVIECQQERQCKPLICVVFLRYGYSS